MKIIPLQTKDLAQFKAYAKQYGVLFASIKDKGAQGEKIDIMFKAEDVSKLNRIYEQLGYTVPKKISADRKNAETRRQTPDPMLTRGKTMEDIDPRPSFKTVAAQLPDGCYGCRRRNRDGFACVCGRPAGNHQCTE